MNKKEEYRQKNESYIQQLAAETEIHRLEKGVLYKVIHSGSGQGTVTDRSIVTCYYRGSLITGKVFDDAWARHCPEAFRVNELIEGFQIALKAMHTGDHWQVFIPWQLGYGKRSGGNIPGYSTLVFEVELMGIG